MATARHRARIPLSRAGPPAAAASGRTARRPRRSAAAARRRSPRPGPTGWRGTGRPAPIPSCRTRRSAGREIAMPGMKPTAAPRTAPTKPMTRAYAAATRRRVRGAAPTADSVARSGRASESARKVAVSVPPSISTPPRAPSTSRMISASSGAGSRARRRRRCRPRRPATASLMRVSVGGSRSPVRRRLDSGDLEAELLGHRRRHHRLRRRGTSARWSHGTSWAGTSRRRRPPARSPSSRQVS